MWTAACFGTARMRAHARTSDRFLVGAAGRSWRLQKVTSSRSPLPETLSAATLHSALCACRPVGNLKLRPVPAHCFLCFGLRLTRNLGATSSTKKMRLHRLLAPLPLLMPLPARYAAQRPKPATSVCNYRAAAGARCVTGGCLKTQQCVNSASGIGLGPR